MGTKFRIGEWLVEPDLNRLVRADRTVQIEPKVMDVLTFLAWHPGEVCPKDSIIKAVWPDTFVCDDVLAHGISELRKVFGDDARDPSVIATIPKRGYRLIAPVSRLQDGLSPNELPGEPERGMRIELPEGRCQETRQAPGDPERPQPTAKEAPVRRTGGRWTAGFTAKAAIALLSTALSLALLVWYLLPTRRSGTTHIGITPPFVSTARSIAVIPFANLSPDPQNSFFTDGFTEDLINQLSGIGHLRVISRAAVARYREDPAISEIEKGLGVEFVLKGSVRREAGQVRITAQLIDAKTGRHLWGETYDRALTGMFRIQSDVARTIAATLRVGLSEAEQEHLRKQPTANLTAYDYYLKGREYYRRYRRHDNEIAIGLFEKAFQLDPNFALAYAGLADCYAQKAYQFGFPPSWTENALEAARKALSIDPDLAEAHKALGFAHAVRGRLQEALKSYYRAVELNPNYSSPIANIAVILEEQGKFFEALQWAQRALSLNPTESISYFNLGDVYWDLHEIDRAEEWYKRALSLNPDYEPAHLAIGRLHVARKNYPQALEESRRILSLNSASVRGLNAAGHTHLASGNLAKAEECYRRVLASGPNQDAAIHLSMILWKQGARDEAQQLFDPLISTSQRDIDQGNESWRARWVIGVVRAARGDTKEALSWLEKAAAAGWRSGPGAWEDPHYENLLGDERFKNLMASLKEDVDQQRRRALLLVSPAGKNQ